MERRDFLKGAAALGTAAIIQPARANNITDGLTTSDLVYLSPIKSNGQPSSCQAEIWFVYDGVEIFVCTDTTSWRAQAPRQGLTTTQFWVGDLGQWQGTNGEYRNLPAVKANASIETNPETLERVLDLFGDKYPLGWVVWGSRFKKGLKNGKRTMLRYKLMT